MSEQWNSQGLLSGHRVLDLTDEKGLLCGRILADWGADVIQIEPPGGHPARNAGPFYKDTPHPERSLLWLYACANKRSITLNLETEDGRDIFKRLAKTAYFVIESYEPGHMASLGLGYSDLEKTNPAIIMISIAPFGQTGPYAHYKATDLILQGLGGLQHILGDPDRPPVRISQPQAFFLGSLHAALGSVVAHYHRELTGEGQHVDVSCQQAVVLTMFAAEIWDLLKINRRGAGPFGTVPRKGGVLLDRYVYPCKDGHVLAWIRGGAQAGMVHSSIALTTLANREGMALELKDFDWTKYSMAVAPQEEADLIAKALGDFIRTKTKDELFREALKESILVCPVTTTKDIAASPQLEAREFWVNVEHPQLGDAVPQPGASVKLGETPWRLQRPAPCIGQHNDDIYRGELGFAPEHVALLKAREVI